MEGEDDEKMSKVDGYISPHLQAALWRGRRRILYRLMEKAHEAFERGDFRHGHLVLDIVIFLQELPES